MLAHYYFTLPSHDVPKGLENQLSAVMSSGWTKSTLEHKTHGSESWKSDQSLASSTRLFRHSFSRLRGCMRCE